MSNDINIKIGTGSAVCPSCKSDDWKSAKMIAMSSITKTSGSVSGSASGTSSDPSLFSGNFLTADHWFSKTNTIDMNVGLDVNLTTTNGLLHEIKLLMLSYNSITQIPKSPQKPKIPVEPRKIGYFEKITPVKPVMPVTPQKDQPPDITMGRTWYVDSTGGITFQTDKPINRPWYINYKEIVIFSFKFLILIAIAIAVASYNNYNFRYGAIIGLFLWVGMIVLGIPVSFFQNKWRQKKYEKLIKKNEENYRKLIKRIEKNYERDMRNYEKAFQSYTQKLQQYKMKCEQAEAQKKAETDSFSLYMEKCSEYEKEYSEYEKKYSLFVAQKNEVMKIREILWHRARLCMRCGTAYIAP